MIVADNTVKQCFTACSEEDKKNGRCSCLSKGIPPLQSLQSCVSDTADFWKDAQDFLKTQLPKEFEENLLSYLKEKKYNQNEFRLFKNMMEEAIGFHATIVLLKHYL